jgi:hypothetical protein
LGEAAADLPDGQGAAKTRLGHLRSGAPFAPAAVGKQEDAGAILDAGGGVAFMDQVVKALALVVGQKYMKMLAHANSISES